MANIKSAKKRIKIAKTRQARNKQVKSMTKMYLKKIEAAVSSKDKATATTVLNDAIKQIDMACSKGVYHKNNAARKVSRLQKMVASLRRLASMKASGSLTAPLKCSTLKKTLARVFLVGKSRRATWLSSLTRVLKVDLVCKRCYTLPVT